MRSGDGKPRNENTVVGGITRDDVRTGEDKGSFE